MPKPLTVPSLERLRRQIDDLEWLLRESGYDAGRWKSKLGMRKDAGRLVLQLRLARQGRKIYVSSVPDPAQSESFGIGVRNFWIDGNHYYDQFAIGTLKELLGPTPEEMEISLLCDLAEEVSTWVEVGDCNDLLRTVKKVRKTVCPPE